jgi:hypothetical protein
MPTAQPGDAAKVHSVNRFQEGPVIPPCERGPRAVDANGRQERLAAGDGESVSLSPATPEEEESLVNDPRGSLTSVQMVDEKLRVLLGRNHEGGVRPPKGRAEAFRKAHGVATVSRAAFRAIVAGPVDG